MLSNSFINASTSGFQGNWFIPPSPHFLATTYRAWDVVLSNSFINASTSGFQGNWYITFNQWAANQTNLTQVRRIVMRAIQAHRSYFPGTYRSYTGMYLVDCVAVSNGGHFEITHPFYARLMPP